MSPESLLRGALWTAALANVGGATLFAFPASGLGPLVALPVDVPVIYRAFTALFVLLFAGAYAFLASQPAINRPFVAFGAIGKTAAFLAMLVLWVSGHATAPAVVLFSADLALAAVFLWSLARLR